jgi:hypothetical protein
MEKRKRAPGGGRKPGEFGKLGAVMSLRLPEKLRAKLKRAADRNGRTLSGEAISRLNASFGGEDLIYWTVGSGRTLRELGSKLEELSLMVAEAKRELGLKSKGKG